MMHKKTKPNQTIMKRRRPYDINKRSNLRQTEKSQES